jgi:hypothetical protein
MTISQNGIVREIDTYAYAVAKLTPIIKIDGVASAIRLLNIMLSRPIIDEDLARAGRTALCNLRTTLLPQTSPDFWYDTFHNGNGEISQGSLDVIAELVAQRRNQILAIETALRSLGDSGIIVG